MATVSIMMAVASDVAALLLTRDLDCTEPSTQLTPLHCRLSDCVRTGIGLVNLNAGKFPVRICEGSRIVRNVRLTG